MTIENDFVFVNDENERYYLAEILNMLIFKDENKLHRAILMFRKNVPRLIDKRIKANQFKVAEKMKKALEQGHEYYLESRDYKTEDDYDIVGLTVPKTRDTINDFAVHLSNELAGHGWNDFVFKPVRRK